jgi:hypothetical protein
MKKILSLIALLTIFSCSTSTDDNGNSNTTAVPLPPNGLTGIVASTTQINLTWTDNSTNETGFKIERKSGTGTYTVVGTTTTDITTFSNTGLTPNTIYTYRVYAYNEVGNSITYTNEGETSNRLSFFSSSSSVGIGNCVRAYGNSVRCLKD